jgi:DNA-binding NarL/FixJ family response regulator
MPNGDQMIDDVAGFDEDPRWQIRVAVVDDHRALREGTRDLLARTPGITVVGVAGDGAGALQLVATLGIDVLILDVHLPDLSGIEVTRRVRASHPDVRILILTGFDEVGYVQALRQLGAHGYLRKSASGRDIVDGVRALAAGRTHFGSTSLPPADDLPESMLASLPPREAEVLQLLARGLDNAEIATSLGMSQRTVEFHVGHLMARLGVRSRVEAAAAARRGFIPEASTPA